ncbi:PIG-L family deacetylase, partial [Segetibacter sp.]|uniref:PIG-L family deacetylase n=1 Tax=Segetibacter sp. TaxID=2231182 RepID=UPI002603770C
MNKLLLKSSLLFLLIAVSFFANQNMFAQNMAQPLYKVMTLSGEKQGAKDLAYDHGISGVWQKLQKLTTTASVLHTQAHPDDEHADLLTYLSRGKGVRTALLSLNRGESGGNVLGGESFDQLGLLRTEEFLLAGSYYGLDDLYFTKLADYGFSKRVEEAYEKWGKQNVLAEMVRVIRINRPLVIVSRFHGTTRDGHGNHQAAGEISQVAFSMAADPTAFPDQISKEGLRPWKALKLYRGGVRPAEHWNVQLNSGEFSPWLGDTYKNFSLLGYSLHRSQVGGHRNEVYGPSFQYYERMQSQVTSDEKENNFFDGIDTTLPAIFKITGETVPTGVTPLLADIASEITKAVSAFEPRNPAAILPFLTTGLSKTREAIALSTTQPNALFMLQIKERQFTDAINSALGIHLEAMAVPVGTKEKRNFYEPQPTMGFAVAGQPFKVETVLVNNSSAPIEPKSIKLIAGGNWKIENAGQDLKPLHKNEKAEMAFTVTAPENTPFSQPYFSRQSIQESQYELKGAENENLPWATSPLQVSASYAIHNQLIEIRMPVQVRQANLPYGYDKYTLKVAPAIGVKLLPRSGIIPRNSKVKMIDAKVELVNNFEGPTSGDLTLKTPASWKVQPVNIPFSFTKAGEKANYSFKISLPSIDEKVYQMQAVARANGK